jgi:flavoprotein
MPSKIVWGITGAGDLISEIWSDKNIIKKQTYTCR